MARPKKIYDIEKYRKDINKAVLKEYLQGVVRTSRDLGVDPPIVSRKEVEVLSSMSFDLIKGVTDEMEKKIKVQLNDGILQGDNNQEIANRLKDIFQGENPTRFRYEDRLRMIARTERTRVLEASSLNTAKKVGAKKKYIDIVHDNRTTEVSKAMFAKYGSPEKAIPLDEEFYVTVNGKEYRGQFPPFLPNDRDTVRYSFD